MSTEIVTPEQSSDIRPAVGLSRRWFLLKLGLVLNGMVASLFVAPIMRYLLSPVKLYLLAYTPLKRISPLCTVIGSVPGAASPLIGWSAAAGRLDRDAWVLYALLLLWQFPHFMAIAWMYREDYDRAGYRVLPGNEGRRRFTALQAAIPVILLIPVSLLPWIGKQDGGIYLGGAICLGVTFAWLALRFGVKTTNVAARQAVLVNISAVQLTIWPCMQAATSSGSVKASLKLHTRMKLACARLQEAIAQGETRKTRSSSFQSLAGREGERRRKIRSFRPLSMDACGS
jgi:heme O synthase-like polyprenyltransferase